LIAKGSRLDTNLPFEVRPSRVHGSGVFATERIRKGKRIIEYTGERVNSEEADARYADDPAQHPLVLLFTVNKNTFIDAAVGGNESRFINHSCHPNCESVISGGKVFIQSKRTIEPGEELNYDYNLEFEPGDEQDLDRYRCRCGTQKCRGSMLSPSSAVGHKTK
jgi:hypothetical protein